MSGLRSSLSRYQPHRSTTQSEIEDLRRMAWHKQGVVSVKLYDPRLSWSDKEQLKQIVTRLYGQRMGIV